mgnify:FL=1
MNTWSSIVQKGIPIDYAERINERNGLISTFGDLYRMLYSKRDIVVNDRDIPVEFHENETGSHERKGWKKFYRKRKVPKKNNKNYPTKPKNNAKRNDITENARYINYVVHGN